MAVIVILRLKAVGHSLLLAVADALILAGIVAILMFLWGVSEAEMYQYVQGVHWKHEAADELLSTSFPEATIPQDRSQPSIQPRLLPALAMMMSRDPLLLGRLEVPRLHFGVMVRQGVDDETLRKAAGHVSWSAMPGSPGNTVILGHRDTFFRPLKNLEDGDTIEIRTAAGRFRYTVESITVVDPKSLKIDRATAPVLTLITCYPFLYTGPAPRRFLVRARLSEENRRGF